VGAPCLSEISVRNESRFGSQRTVDRLSQLVVIPRSSAWNPFGIVAREDSRACSAHTVRSALRAAKLRFRRLGAAPVTAAPREHCLQFFGRACEVQKKARGQNSEKLSLLLGRLNGVVGLKTLAVLRLTLFRAVHQLTFEALRRPTRQRTPDGILPSPFGTRRIGVRRSFQGK
jgi:hypothetical protein